MRPSMSGGSPLWLRGLAVLVASGLVIVGAVLAWLKGHEAELVFRTSISHGRTSGRIPLHAERLVIRGAAGSELAALILRADPARDTGFWVLHLHGNADSAFSDVQLRHCQGLRNSGLNVLSFDYRGFGLSPGVVSEAHMDQDAEAAYDELIHRGVSAQRIILWGHSLGSGPAVVLAAQHSVAALVLFGAFTSVPDAAQDTYPYLPVRWIVGVHFDSLRRIRDVHVPVLIAHSVGDALIPYREGQRLFAAANEPKQFLTLNGPSADGFGGHVDALYEHPELLLPALSKLIGAPL